jgi:hypothetical protein
VHLPGELTRQAKPNYLGKRAVSTNVSIYRMSTGSVAWRETHWMDEAHSGDHSRAGPAWPAPTTLSCPVPPCRRWPFGSRADGYV